MREPVIRKFPTEIFCYPYTDHTSQAINALSNQYCSYLQSTCNKPRKSEPAVKVGVCSIGYKGSFVSGYMPVTISRETLAFA